MKAHITLSVFLFIISANAVAQSQDSYNYDREFTWGINKNSSSGLIGGFVFKKSHKLNDYTLETFGLEIMNIRHPQEVRKTSANTGNFFVYGKSNYLYSFRFQYGRDFIIFQKAPQQGVEIKAVFAGGLSVGVVAPYYITLRNTGLKEQYDPNNTNHQFENIDGNGGIFYGLSESDLVLGGNLKAALNFETGALKSQVTGFEIGFLLDAYAKEIIIVPTAPNKAVYPTIFITIFYGSRK